MTDWHGVVLPPDLGARLDRVLAALQATRSSATAQTVRVLLAGAPGVGKTEVRRALAESCGLPLIKVGPRDLGNGMLGGATVAVKALFERARQAAPSMILSDNFEQFAWHRDARDGGSATTERIMATMMELDGGSSSERGPVSIVTETYDLNLVDEAVLRRGFDVIEIPLPNEVCRVEILCRALRKAPVSPDLDVDETAAALGLLLDARSGRDLERLVKETVTNAFEDADRRGVDFQNIRITREMLFDHKMVRQVLPPQAVNFGSLDLPEEVQRRFRP